MRFMIIRKADAITESEADSKPSPELLDAMGSYIMKMIEAGVFISGDGLQPSRKGARVKVSRDGKPPAVTDGPFAEVKELIAGVTLIEVPSMEVALDWVKRWPREDGPVELEIRQIYELSDFEIGPDDKPDVWSEVEKALTDRQAKA